jgi:spermidine synthase
VQILPQFHPRNLGLTNVLPPFLLGFLATSFQILLLREFSAYFYGNELTIGIVLACWLLWGGLGSIAAPKIKLDTKHLFLAYGLVILLFPVSLLGVRFSRFILHLLPGELTGMASVLLMSLALCFLISFPLGALFVFNVNRAGGRMARVYIFESLGAATAGLIVHLLLLPFISAWLAASIIGAVTALAISFTTSKKPPWLCVGFILVFLGGFCLFDLPSQKIYWKPFELVAGRDTRYGKLQVIKTQEQISLYGNSIQVYSYPNLAAAEESVHFALLQYPEAQNALLIGGGAGGSLKEMLKYPRLEVDYVELDPEIIRLSQRFLSPDGKKALNDGRVHLFFQDGRAFLQKIPKKYDLIILNLPEPATAQVNRFYTREFFFLAKRKLAPNGLFSFTVPSAENYISPDLKKFLSSLYFTLSDVFPEVKVVPGDRNIFLASARPLTIDAADLSQRIASNHLANTYVSPSFLASRLHPRRVKYLDDMLRSGEKRANLDLAPVSFFFYSVLWNTQFKSADSKILGYLSGLSSFWLLDFPLLLFLLLLLFFYLKKKRTSFFLTPLVIMGFTTIAVEIILLVWFQALYGYLYGRIALLLTAFMLGLFSGSLAGSRIKVAIFQHLLVIQALFVVLLFLFHMTLEASPPELLAFLFLFFFGFLGGGLFLVSNRLYLREKANYGLGYGLDLAGSFLGALITSSVLIPLVGLPLLLRYLILLNSFCFLFLLVRPRNP